MSTKKLVLGFCVLASVTVGAPKVFGDTVGHPVVRGLIVGGHVFQGQAAILSWDRRQRATYENILKAEAERIAQQEAELKQMVDSEVDCVERSLWHSHYAFLVRRSASRELGEASRTVDRIQQDLLNAQNDLRIAEDDAKQTWLAKMIANIKVNMLKAKLAKASRVKEIAKQKNEVASEKASVHDAEAQKFKTSACDWREIRIASVTEMLEADIRKRGENGQNKDFRILQGGVANLSPIAVERIRLSALEDLIILSSCRCCLDWTVAFRVCSIIRSHSDECWVSKSFPGYDGQCIEAHKWYQPLWSDYCDCNAGNNLSVREQAVFGRAYELQAQAYGDAGEASSV
jgi:hypothetical protein